MVFCFSVCCCLFCRFAPLPCLPARLLSINSELSSLTWTVSFDEHFHSLSGKYALVSQGAGEGLQGDKVLPRVVLMIAQLSLFVEQNAVPRITEEIAAAFSGGSARGHEHGPAFVPAEICRIFHISSEKFLQLEELEKAKTHESDQDDNGTPFNQGGSGI